MKSTSLLCLLFVSIVLLLLVDQIQAAITHILPSIKDQKQNDLIVKNPNFTITPIVDAKPETIIPIKQQFSRKFIILTTGENIKLYPFVSAVNNSSSTNDFALSDSYYLIKPIEFNISDNAVSEGLDPNSPFTLFLKKKLETRAKLQDGENIDKQARNKASILPSQEDVIDDKLYEGASTPSYRKPWITEVDYLLDRKFCLNKDELNDNDCLVVIWLDKNNGLVRYGSIDLRKNPIHYNPRGNSSLSTAKTNVLWLEEFFPIAIDRVQSCRFEDNDCSYNVYTMVVDRQRNTIHIAIGSSYFSYPDRILTKKLLPNRPSQETYSFYRFMLDDEEQLLGFNLCDRNLATSTFDNLNVDEENGDWLFYLDKYAGAILAIDTYSKWRTISCGSTIHALVFGIKKYAKRERQNNLNPIGMAMDSKRRRLYWISSMNEIFDTDYSGIGFKHKGVLSYKPAIRNPHCLQVYQDTLFISDSTKKSLIAIKLGNQEPTHHGIFSPRIFNEEPAKNLSHQVLLIEMPALYGFRLVDLDGTTGILSKGDGTSRQEMREKEDLLIKDHVEAESRSIFGHFIAFLLRHGLCSEGNEYDVLLDRAYSSPHCAYSQLHLRGRIWQDSNLISEILCFVCLAVAIGMIIYLVYNSLYGERETLTIVEASKDIKSKV